LFGVEAKMFWERLWPAVGILLATSGRGGFDPAGFNVDI
jgi:hypothetical protein